MITLSIMGLSTVLIGLTPTYASIGIWSPILLTLLRLLQGLALGGEWGGGVLLAVEYSPAHKRGFFGAVPQTGALFGLALGNFATSGLSALFSEEAFLSYGWRIPFVLSIVLVLIGMWIRNKVEETPSFRKVAAEARDNPKNAGERKMPLVETLTRHWRAVLIAIGAKFVETSTFFLFATFTISYLVGLGYPRVQALNVVLVAALIAVPVMLYFGALSDRIGRKKVFACGTVAIALYALPYFWLLNQGSALIATAAVVLGFPSSGPPTAPCWARSSPSFPPNVRYTGVSLGYQVGAALVGGPMPLIATALLARYDGSYVPVAVFIVLAPRCR